MGTKSATAACVGGLVLTCCALNALAEPLIDLDALAEPPIEVSGVLETSVISRQLPGDDGHEISSQVLGYSHLSTYLWQPWLAVVSADLNAAFENYIDGYEGEGDFGEATSLAGDFTLSALPLSRYPFQLFFSSSDNRFDGDYSGSNYSRKQAGLSGRAAFSDRFSLDYLVSYDEADRDNYGDLIGQRADATLRHSFSLGEMPLNITDIGISLAYYNTDFKSERAGESNNSSQSWLGTFYYHAAPIERLDHDFRVTVISDQTDSNQFSFDRLSEQGVGTIQWRSPANDFTTTGAVRILHEQIDFLQVNPDTERALISANAGVNWRATDRLTMSLGARANAERTETVPDESIGVQFDPLETIYGAGVLGSIDYRSLSHELAGFNWHWDARADGDFGYDKKDGSRSIPSVSTFDQSAEDFACKTKYGTFYFGCKKYGTRSYASASIGHTFDRSMDLPGIATVNASFFQEIGFAHDSVDEAFEPILTHSASFSHGFADETGSSYFRLYLRDTHNIGERPEGFQTAQIDLTQRMTLSGNQSLQGNLSAQGVRQAADGQDDFYISALADLEYEYRDLFGIAGLSFLSNLRINAIGLDDLTRYWNDDLNPDLFRNDWRNRLQYHIGKLWLSLEGTLYQEDQELGHYVRFTARRTFD